MYAFKGQQFASSLKYKAPRKKQNRIEQNKTKPLNLGE